MNLLHLWHSHLRSFPSISSSRPAYYPAILLSKQAIQLYVWLFAPCGVDLYRCLRPLSAVPTMSRYGSPLQRLIIAFSLVQIAFTAAIVSGTPLQLRQSNDETSSLPVSCLEYSSIANLSTIGLNSTYRAAFLEASPEGTDQSAGLLNDAEAKLPPLTANKQLNQQCGNLTTVALEGAATNFTHGIVAQFRINAGARNRDGLGLAVTCCLVTLGMVLLV